VSGTRRPSAAATLLQSLGGAIDAYLSPAALNKEGKAFDKAIYGYGKKHGIWKELLRLSAKTTN
jgi:hypothetical protein